MRDELLVRVVEQYLQAQGYAVFVDLWFRHSPPAMPTGPAPDGRVDLIGIHPRRWGPSRVCAISFDGTQSGLDPQRRSSELHQHGGPHSAFWAQRKELWQPERGKGMLDAVEAFAGQRSLCYLVATRRLTGDPETYYAGKAWSWLDDELVRSSTEGFWIGFLSLSTALTALSCPVSPLNGARSEEFLAGVLMASRGLPNPGGESAPEPFTDEAFSHTSLAGLYDPPPFVNDLAEVGRYANGFAGYEYAVRQYRVEPGPTGLARVVNDLLADRPGYERWEGVESPAGRASKRYPRPTFHLSFEDARLVQYLQVRAWHHSGYAPEDPDEVDQHLALHRAICEAWHDGRFAHPRPTVEDWAI